MLVIIEFLSLGTLVPVGTDMKKMATEFFTLQNTP